MHQSRNRRSLTRRTMVGTALALAGAGPAIIGTRAARAADKVLKVVLVSDLKGIDPVFNTATYAAYHGYLVYDQLFALDSKGKPQPQMVESYEVSADRSAYKFRLRGGLKFHDGSPVRAADAVASILRWKDRDVVGKAMFAAGAKLEAVDDAVFTLGFSQPFGLVLDALSKPTATRCSSCRVGRQDPGDGADFQRRGIRPLRLREAGMATGRKGRLRAKST